MEIKMIGVVGAGQMGSGIAEVALTSGFNVLMRDVTMEAVQKGRTRIVTDFDKRVQKGKMTSTEEEEILQRLSTTIKLEDLGKCDFIIEAAVENIPLKWEIFTKARRGDTPRDDPLRAILLLSPSHGSLPSPRGQTVSSECTSSILHL